MSEIPVVVVAFLIFADFWLWVVYYETFMMLCYVGWVNQLGSLCLALDHGALARVPQ
jgi:hypothetical protein